MTVCLVFKTSVYDILFYVLAGAIIAFNSPSYIGEEGTVDITLTLTLMGIPAGGIEEEIVVSFGLGTDGSERSGMLVNQLQCMYSRSCPLEYKWLKKVNTSNVHVIN